MGKLRADTDRVLSRGGLLGQRFGRHIAAVFALGLVMGCSTSTSQGLPFLAAGTSFSALGSDSGKAPTKTSFAGGDVVLSAPRGHCVDPHMTRRDRQGGFALLPRCSLLNGNTAIGHTRTAVITATVGQAAEIRETPQAADLAKAIGDANLLESREGGSLTIAKLHLPGHRADGASPVHWRAAFVLNKHLVVLALYAPDGSPMLENRGAKLLTEMAELTREASTDVTSPKVSLRPKRDISSPPLDNDSGYLRPQSRPADSIRTSSNKTTQPRQSIAKRLVGIFQ